MCAQLFSQVQLFATPRTVVHQALLSMGFSRQEYWSGLPSPSPGGLPDPGIEPVSPAFPSLAGGFFTTEPLGSPLATILVVKYKHLSQTGNSHFSHSLARVEEDATEAAAAGQESVECDCSSFFVLCWKPRYLLHPLCPLIWQHSLVTW